MAQYVYTMQNVSKVVPPKRTILENISLSFFPGAKIGVLGLNGAGKSSLLKIMAGVDAEHDGEARPAKGLRVGYLTQEPELDESLDVRGNVEQGMGELVVMVNEYNAISDRFAEPMSSWSARETWQPKLTQPTAGTSTAPWKSPRTRYACRPGMRTSASCPAASGGGWRCANCCSPSPTCCCWTNPPTTWMQKA